MNRLPRLASLPAILLLNCLVGSVRAEDPCASFTWNVAHERSLFAAVVKAEKAATEARSASAAMHPTRSWSTNCSQATR